MNKKDRIALVIIILLPLIIGMFKVTFGDASNNSKISNSLKKSVGVIHLKGVIMSSQDIIEQIKKHRDDKNIVAVILHINSPGGSVPPTQEIYQELLTLRAVKPLYISMGSVAASGGYYLAATGNKIYANSGTLTGSIGVIMQMPHYGELLNKIGVGMHTITAGTLKDAGSPFKKLTDKDRAYFEELLKDTHSQFINDIAFARGIDTTEIIPYAEGQVFTGNMALKIGLVDEIATFEQVKKEILTLHNLPINSVLIEKEGIKPDYFSFMNAKFSNKINSLFPKSGIYYLSPVLK